MVIDDPYRAICQYDLAKVWCEKNHLLEDALFEDRLVGVGLLVADLHPLVAYLAGEVLCVGFLGKLVDVLAEAILLDEVCILHCRVEARCFGNARNLATADASFDGGPSLRGRFVATLLPSV